MYPIKQSTAETIPFFAHDVNGDGVTGLVDGGFTKRISKGSGAFAAMTVTVTEMENGWYSIPLSGTHSDTVGLLTVSLSHASTKRVNLQWRVSARTLDELASPTNITAATGIVLSGVTHTGAVIPTVTAVTGLTAANLDTTISSRMATYTQPTGFLAATFPAGTVANTTNITAGTLTTVTTATNLTTNNDKTGYALTAVTGLGNQTANITGNLVGTVSTVTAVTGLTASDVGAIKAKTDNLTYTVANVLDSNVQRINDVTITGNGQVGTEFGV